MALRRVLIVFALERRRRRALEALDQLVHRLLEAGRAAGRELDRDRPVRLGEIVDIDPVRRARPGGRRLGEHGLDHLSHADAGPADHKQVESRPVDLRAELNRLERARLPDEPIDWRELRGGGEGEIGQIAGAIELAGGQGADRAPRCSNLVHHALLRGRSGVASNSRQEKTTRLFAPACSQRAPPSLHSGQVFGAAASPRATGSRPGVQARRGIAAGDVAASQDAQGEGPGRRDFRA